MARPSLVTVVEWEPGTWNSLRVWLRKRFGFRKYRLYIEPVIGWPTVRRVERQGQNGNGHA